MRALGPLEAECLFRWRLQSVAQSRIGFDRNNCQYSGSRILAQLLVRPTGSTSMHLETGCSQRILPTVMVRGQGRRCARRRRAAKG